MNRFNIEIKATVTHPDNIRKILRQEQAKFIGVDFQTDIYFNVPHGRLKLRQGNIENALIFYDRRNEKGPKPSHITIQPLASGNNLLDILTQSLGILAEVKKEREIYFIDNIKIHLDNVEGLGNFVEIEAISRDNRQSESSLREQCLQYINRFNIPEEDMISMSYSDMILAQKV